MPKCYATLFSVVVFAVVLLVGCTGRNEPTGGKPGQGAQPAAKGAKGGKQASAGGYELFHRTCDVCHGREGNGRGSRSGPSLQRPEYAYGRTREAVMESIRNGRPNGMPAFGHVFSKEELEALTSYVLTLK